MARIPRRPTLADVARLAGASTAVVSYVVNDGPRAVSPATKLRVEAAIAELGYRKNVLAGALSAGRSNFVGLLVPDTGNGFFGEMLRHIEGEGRLRGLLTLIGNTGYDPKVSNSYGTAFADLTPHGIFETNVVGAGAPTDASARVYVHAAPAQTHLPTILFDNFNAAEVVVSHLLEHGYDDIHCFSGLHKAGPAKEREEGWHATMVAAGRLTNGKLHRIPFERIAAEQAAQRILSGPHPPRAVFASTDEQALGVIRAARSLGLRVPEDVAVAGIDGIVEALSGSVQVTTVFLSLQRLAAEAFDALDRFLEAGESSSIVLPGRLVIGETCGCSVSPPLSAGR